MHRGEDDLPWVDLDATTRMKITHVNLNDGLWVVREQIQPGTQVQTHRHTGPVIAITLAGSWHYLESPEQINHAGSYLFEPSGSTHTLKVLDDSDGPVDVWFIMYGANLNLDSDGKIEWVLDGPTMLAVYRAMCAQQGLPEPDVLVEQ
ncbi:MAG: cupin [Mycobacterium sp.]|nr:MAG: cupin [Mycobacterium sp.]PJE24726.1 MAG: cupin [Mycobacterium sp.]